jgi:hypothetical protein
MLVVMLTHAKNPSQPMRLLGALLVVLVAVAHAEDGVAMENYDITGEPVEAKNAALLRVVRVVGGSGDSVDAKNAVLLRTVRVVNGTANVRGIAPSCDCAQVCRDVVGSFEG